MQVFAKFFRFFTIVSIFQRALWGSRSERWVQQSCRLIYNLTIYHVQLMYYLVIPFVLLRSTFHAAELRFMRQAALFGYFVRLMSDTRRISAEN